MSKADDYRAGLSPAEFIAIRSHPDDPIDGYYDVLIDRNPRLDHTFKDMPDENG
jgi:hypothetical protein